MENLLIRASRSIDHPLFSWHRQAIRSMLLGSICAVVLASCGNDSTTEGTPAKTTQVEPITTSSVASAPAADFPSIREVVPHYATDVRDLRRLAGLAEAVFAGTVSEQSGVIIRYGQANTQFKVNVLQALKGTPANTVTVEQEGGRDEKKNTTYIIKDDTPLKVGGTYLFAATYRENERVYGIIPVYGNTPLTDEQTSELQAGKTPQPVTEMRGAVAHQIPS
ncbi:hypothetical protein [Mycobacteroides sp. PCS013]|uniref:hypothetical protein n=1 Tax=Mycobacteroides sp. PCS013 TaxID=3074106 RepID=UPI003C2C12B9